jgi:heme exporter protein A
MAGCLIANQLTCTRLTSPVTFTLHAGESLCVQGKNGSGKSTLLKILSGLRAPSLGKLRWNNKPIDADYRQHLIYLGHASGLKTGLTIEENWLSTLAIHQQKPNTTFDELLDLFHLPKHTRAVNLSAGQQQKAALANCVLLKKRVWILDEPESNLDNETKKTLAALMHAHLNEGGLLIISSHENPLIPSRALHL